MGTKLQKWEKDPVFFAAEQVQDSADNLDSAYRAWMRAKTLPPEDAGNGDSGPDILEFFRHQLTTALGIAVGQLAEFEKGVSTLPAATDADPEDDASNRRTEFISVIHNQIMCIQHALRTSKDVRDSKVLPTVGFLGQTEVDQFALFLSGAGAAGSTGMNMQGRRTSHPHFTRAVDTNSKRDVSASLLGARGLHSRNLDLALLPHITCMPSMDTAGARKQMDFDGSVKEVRMGINSEFSEIAVVDNAVSELLQRDCYEGSTTCLEGLIPILNTYSSCGEYVSCPADFKGMHKEATISSAASGFVSRASSGVSLGARTLKSLILKKRRDNVADAHDISLHEMLGGSLEAYDCEKGLCYEGTGSMHEKGNISFRKARFRQQLFYRATPALLLAGVWLLQYVIF